MVPPSEKSNDILVTILFPVKGYIRDASAVSSIFFLFSCLAFLNNSEIFKAMVSILLLHSLLS